MDVRIAVIGLLAACGLSSSTSEKDLEVVYQWPLLSWAVPPGYPSDQDFQADRAFFNSIEVGWDRIFLTTPRIWKGNPATLNWIPRPKVQLPSEPSPPLQAYPSWEWHADAVTGNTGNCTGFVSIFRARADRCNRLWVLDSGVLDSLVTFTVACPPKLVIFDMSTDQPLRIVTLPRDVLRPNSLLSNLVLDEQSAPGGYGCDDTFVYMSDTTNPGIVVYDFAKDQAWRLQHPFMFPDPMFGTYKVAGESFTLMDGILGMSLSGGTGPQERQLFFQPFASDRLLSIPTSVLQAGPNPGDDGELPVTLAGTKSSQAAGLATDPRDGALIFSPISETAIASWIPGTADYKVISYSPELLQVVLDFRPADRDSGNIWLLSTRMQKFFRRTINPEETNLRVMRLIPTQDVFNNTLLYY
ncbi:unnamed protein product [Nezara viridula]|uniref:Uncharacterized protein n=1 Tax=Nezara viridula TaxID=85310 RepID=A0A9P0E682_NEZVI|nr:unnamed protein product [Nezara viridula]